MPILNMLIISSAFASENLPVPKDVPTQESTIIESKKIDSEKVIPSKEGANKWVVPSPLTPCHI